jgi:succinate dehydrogenase/fumarate reductase cytochrome b subunit
VSKVPETKTYVAHVVLWVGLVLALPLWQEFHEPEQLLWNVFLAAFLIALVVGAFLGVRHLQKNGIEVGEARFTTTDENAR